MNKYDFTTLVKDPKKLGNQDVESLKLLVAEFPYFAVGQNLLIKALHNTNHYEYEKYLKQAALQAGDRSVLYNLVHDLPPETESLGAMDEAVDALKNSAHTLLLDENSDFSESNDQHHNLAIAPAQGELPNLDQTAIPVEIALAPPFIADLNVENKAEPIEIPVTSQPELTDIHSETVFTEPLFSKPEPIVEIPKTTISESKPEIIIRENTESEITKAPRFIIPDSEPDITLQPQISNEVGADDKLVESTGKFLKYIPKSNPNVQQETSLVKNFTEQEEMILQDFDISSLEDISITPKTGFVPLKNIVPEKESKSDETNKNSETEPQTVRKTISIIEPDSELNESDFFDFNNAAHVPAEDVVAPINTSQNNIELVAEVEKTNELTDKNTDTDFINWLKNNQKNEIIEPIHPQNEIKTAEDEHFVNEFQSKLGAESDALLQAEILKSVSTELELKEILSPQETPPSEIAPTIKAIEDAPSAEIETYNTLVVSAIPIEPIDNEFKAFDFFEQLKHPSSKNTQHALLKSLEDYEVNEFLAPLYTQVSYNLEIFNAGFQQFYSNKSSQIEPNNPIKIAENAPFVVLNQGIETEKPKPVVKPKPENYTKHIVPIYNVEEAIAKSKQIATEKPIDDNAKIHRESNVNESILDKFIRENPTIARPKSEFYSPFNMAKQSAEDNDEIVSETLAKIYTQQSLYKKAITMYEKLGLLYPNKLSYFAALINQIKTEHNIE